MNKRIVRTEHDKAAGLSILIGVEMTVVVTAEHTVAILTGATYENKTFIKSDGFRWIPVSKDWRKEISLDDFNTYAKMYEWKIVDQDEIEIDFETAISIAKGDLTHELAKLELATEVVAETGITGIAKADQRIYKLSNNKRGLTGSPYNYLFFKHNNEVYYFLKSTMAKISRSIEYGSPERKKIAALVNTSVSYDDHYSLSR